MTAAKLIELLQAHRPDIEVRMEVNGEESFPTDVDYVRAIDAEFLLITDFPVDP